MTQAQQPAGSPSRFCSNCGTGLSPQAGFCPQCGTAVSPIQAPGLIPTQQEQQPRQPVEPPQPQVWQPSSTPAYSPPDRVLPNSFGLGGRGSRLGAAIIDGLIGLVPYIVLVAVVPILGLLLLAGVFILQMILLTKDSQTLGKKALGPRIVKVNTGENGGFIPNVLLRFILNGILGLIPLYAIVDALFIFRGDRRCIHDMIAGTRVIEA